MLCEPCHGYGMMRIDAYAVHRITLRIALLKPHTTFKVVKIPSENWLKTQMVVAMRQDYGLSHQLSEQVPDSPLPHFVSFVTLNTWVSNEEEKHKHLQISIRELHFPYLGCFKRYRRGGGEFRAKPNSRW